MRHRRLGNRRRRLHPHSLAQGDEQFLVAQHLRRPPQVRDAAAVADLPRHSRHNTYSETLVAIYSRRAAMVVKARRLLREKGEKGEKARRLLREKGEKARRLLREKDENAHKRALAAARRDAR